MPIYRWRNRKTNEEVEVMRSFDDSGVPPDESGDWEKMLGTFRLTRGDNWTGSKGNW